MVGTDLYDVVTFWGTTNKPTSISSNKPTTPSPITDSSFTFAGLFANKYLVGYTSGTYYYATEIDAKRECAATSVECHGITQNYQGFIL